jgi:hypothetical protein
MTCLSAAKYSKKAIRISLHVVAACSNGTTGCDLPFIRDGKIVSFYASYVTPTIAASLSNFYKNVYAASSPLYLLNSRTLVVLFVPLFAISKAKVY